jgi:DNA-binding Lrp family transcriptional regulator
MEKLTAAEKKVARLIQRDIPVTGRPFGELAGINGLDKEEFLDTILKLLREGFIRKFGAILRHQEAGYTGNALVIWSVPPDQIEKAGRALAAFDSVSHCYERKPAFQNKYSLFTMLHTKDEDVLSLIKKMAAATGIRDYLMLESLQEYKKTSPEYFNDQD